MEYITCNDGSTLHTHPRIMKRAGAATWGCQAALATQLPARGGGARTARHTMTTQDKTTKDFVASNIAYLLNAREWSQAQLARKAGVAPKSITNVLRVGSPISPTVAMLDALFGALGVPTWLGVMPIEDKSLLESRDVARLITLFAQLDRDGRTQVLRTAEQELRYQQHRRLDSSDPDDTR